MAPSTEASGRPDVAAIWRWRQCAVLTRHFVRRFTSLEAIAPGTEAREALVPILSLLALPGYVLALAAFTGAAATRDDPAQLYSARWLLLAWSFVVVGILATVQWEAFFLDERDWNALVPLPVRGTEIFAAKVTSLFLAVAVFHACVNSMSGMVFPLAFLPHYTHTAAAHHVVLALQSIFVAFGVASLQGMIARLCPARLARHASHAAQALLLVGLASLLMLQEPLGRWVREARGSGALVNVLFPPAWFMALYDLLLGDTLAHSGLPATLAVGCPVVAVSAGALLCLMSMRTSASFRDGAETSRSRRSLGRQTDRAVARICLRSPREIAIYGFVQQALRAGGRARLVLLAWVAVGVALSLSIALPALRDSSARGEPGPALLAPAHVLTLLGLVGFRLSAALPVALEANWIFRAAEPPSAREYIRATRAAALRVVVVPLLTVVGVFSLATWDFVTVAAHVTLTFFVALLTVEIVFFGFEKIPFACSYVPGRARLRVRWPLYAAIGLVYCAGLPAVEASLLRSPRAIVMTVGALAAGVWALRRMRESAAARAAGPVFDEQPPPHTIRLDLRT